MLCCYQNWCPNMSAHRSLMHRKSQIWKMVHLGTSCTHKLYNTTVNSHPFDDRLSSSKFLLNPQGIPVRLPHSCHEWESRCCWRVLEEVVMQHVDVRIIFLDFRWCLVDGFSAVRLITTKCRAYDSCVCSRFELERDRRGIDCYGWKSLWRTWDSSCAVLRIASWVCVRRSRIHSNI